MSDVLWDLRYAIRMLLRSPGFTLVAVLTLALGVGANTAVFSVVNTMILQPLPFDEPDRVVMLWQQNLETGFEQEQVAWADFFDWQSKSTTFESLGCVINNMAFSRNFLLRVGDDVTRIRGRHVSSGLFDVLGVPPLLGRTFEPADDQPGGPHRAVLSHALWTQAFASNPDVVGQTLHVGRGDPFEIMGVMPPSYRFPQDAEVWLSVAGFMEEKSLVGNQRRRDSHALWVVGRLRRDVTVQEAHADLNAIQQQIFDEPENAGIPRLASDVIVTPLLDQVNGSETRPALCLLLGAVAFVLLIACANVANLLLARAVARRKEMAIRVSLGAGRLRVVRQLLTESLLLALMGAGAGVLFAVWGIHLLELIRTDATYLGVKEFRFDRLAAVEVDVNVLGFTIAVSLVTGVLFGLIPAIQASKLNVNETLKEEGRSGTPGKATRFFRNGLLVSEVALALVLLFGAGLALRGFTRMLDVDPGLQPANVLRAELDLDMAEQVHGVGGFDGYHEVIRRLSALPGVVSVAACGEVPLIKSGWNDTFKILQPDFDNVPHSELPTTDVRVMSPGAFRTLGIPLLEGRDFNDQDSPDNLNVTVVNQALAQKFFPNASPLGQTIQMRGWKGHEKIIVGVVGNVRNYSRDSVDQPELYFPFLQTFLAGSEVGPVLLIRIQGDPLSMVPAIRHAVDGPDPKQQVLIRFQDLDQLLDMSVSQERFRTVLLGCFAAVALVLAATGVYGVIAYSTSQRIQEIGIRMALGARPGQVLRQIVGQGVVFSLAGIAVGAAAAIALGRILTSVLPGVEASDPFTLAGVSLLLLSVGVAASLVPARRAMRVDPMTALRFE